ncbi:MAG: hypothetical protein WDW36_000397 [Sanguina aurantia]
MQPLPPFNPQTGTTSSMMSTSKSLSQHAGSEAMPDALMQHIDNTALVQQWRERQQKQRQQQQQQSSQPPPPPMYYISEPPRTFRVNADSSAQEEFNNSTLYQLQRLQLQQPHLQLQMIPQQGGMSEYGTGGVVPLAGLWPSAVKPGQVDGRGRMSASLYVKNLPLNADKLFLYERFAPFGAILSVKVLTDEETVWNVSARPIPNPSGNPPSKPCLSRTGGATQPLDTHALLLALTLAHLPPSLAGWAADPTGRCRGVGFVNYLERSVAIFAANALQGSRIDGKPLHVALQEPRQT